MKTHLFRLTRGADLRAEIEAYARAHNIAAAVVVSGVGCLTQAVVRDAGGTNLHTLSFPQEIVSLTGTVSAARTHLHISLADAELTVRGGHLSPGCIVNTTAEIALMELDGVEIGTEFDPATGYEEMTVRPLTQRST